MKHARSTLAPSLLAAALAAVLSPPVAAQAPPATTCERPGSSDGELIASLRRTLETAEGELDSMRSQRFLRLHDGFMPELKCLWASAQQQLAQIPASGPDAAARFARWDDSVGGPAFVLARRWAALPARRSNGLMTMTDLFANDGGLERENWRTLTDYQGGETANLGETMRRAIDERVPATRPPAFSGAVPATGTGGRRPKPGDESITVIATPGTLGVAMASAQLGHGLGQAIGMIAAHRREYVQLENRLARDRDAYWRCRLGNCADLAARQASFVEALMLKDVFILRRPSATAFDGGIVLGCNPQYLAMHERAQALIAMNPDSAPAAWNQEARAVFTSPAYGAWQACRDRAEYIVRLRTPLL